MRWILLALLLLTVAWLLFPDTRRPEPTGYPSQGLPWQIELHEDGTSTVFGVTLETTRLAEVLDILGTDMELAIVAAPGKPGNLEMYYGHYRTGLLTGKLILRAAVDAERLALWRSRAVKQEIMATGEARKFILAGEDRRAALQARVEAITFVAAIRLDAEIVRGRFGEPGRRIQTRPGVIHYLYPALGLDVTVSEEVRDVIQYVAPRSFERLLRPLRDRSG